jgi:hypothetical protein
MKNKMYSTFAIAEVEIRRYSKDLHTGGCDNTLRRAGPRLKLDYLVGILWPQSHTGGAA